MDRVNPYTDKRPLIFILIVVSLDLIGMTVLGPVAAYIVRQYSGDALAVSMLTVFYAMAQFIAAPFLGKLSDHYGRRPVLLVSVFGSAVGYYLFGIGGALWVLLLSRLIDGFTGGNISTASAYIADVTPPEDRARNFALLGAAFGLGFILGPALGGALSQLGLTMPAFAAGTLSMASTIVGYFVLPESLPKNRRVTAPLRWQDLNPFESIVDLLRRPVVGGVLFSQCIFNFVFNGRNSVLAVFAIDQFAAPPSELAVLFVVGGVTMVIVQGMLVGRLTKRVGEQKLAVSGLVIQGIAGLGMLIPAAFWQLYPLSILSSGSAGLIYPTMGALAANSVPLEEQGKVNGVSTALGSLMSVFGPLWAGAIYDGIAPTAPFWMGGVLFVLAGVLLARVTVTSAVGRTWPAQPVAE